MISYKKTDRQYYGYQEWTRRYNEWTDEYYEWTYKYQEWADEYYVWKNDYYEWRTQYYEWTNEYYEQINEYYEWINEYQEYYDWPSEYYEWQDGFCDNNYPELMPFLIYESKIPVFFLKTTFGKSLFMIIIFTCTLSKIKRCFVGGTVKFHTGCFFMKSNNH